jgi:cell envelope opacity-associated protein A
LEAEHLKARLKAAEEALANEVAAKERSERQLQEQAEKQAPPLPDCSAFFASKGHVL